jgi:diacylglycerol O-acyltransferase/trehalose O-mycolyltransferase
MRRVLVAVVLAAGVLASTRPAAAAPVCAAPGCVDVAVPVPAGLKVPENRVRVLLPEGYDANPCRRYPVLYLLHGAGDTYKTWSENTDVIAFAKTLPLIIVMPDSGRNAEAGWYSDWSDGSRQWETFHMGVLPPFIERTFRTQGDGHRLIAGLSMGGFGAMSYAGRHPGMFRAAASFSGAVDTMYGFPLSGPGFSALHDQFGTPDDRLWGNQLTSEATWREHNPTDLAAKLAGTPLFIASGTGTPGGPAGDAPDNPGGYGLEAFIFQMNVSFVRALTVAGVPFTSDLYPGGYHGWPYWERELHWALPQMVPLVTSGAEADVCAAPVANGPGRGAVLAQSQTAGGTLPTTGGADWPLPVGLGLAAVAAFSRRLRRAA